DGLRAGVNPFTHGSQLYTDVMKTEALRQALDKYGFDAAFGGARRDEEKSRAKERIFSFRSAGHRWDPRQQRPELWALYNTRKRGCYPLTAAIESGADTLSAIIRETLLSRSSERRGRVIDHDAAASMERKKQEGYF